ncbi:MAG: hypothetical protein PHH54_03365 [Candidatus Nanoarchaeia archaeon]|nr:hypothetical protein [Candidatus Nanoarchaeia archaeon]MDD5740996.1 hypothetical protein [Candidatus Nanoarchaeia archaeon]
MINLELINKLVEFGAERIKPLFKKRQFEVLKKISLGIELSDTEKRYLRGYVGRKLKLLNELNANQYNPRLNDYSDFLTILSNYYITGLEALKINGYGWDLQTNTLEVINTKLNGEIQFSNKLVKLIKVRSIKKAEFLINNSTSLRYATNEQIIKDTNITKNMFVKKKWANHYLNYGSEFSKFNPGKVND